MNVDVTNKGQQKSWFHQKTLGTKSWSNHIWPNIVDVRPSGARFLENSFAEKGDPSSKNWFKQIIHINQNLGRKSGNLKFLGTSFW
jgi:hypothetical protein